MFAPTIWRFGKMMDPLHEMQRLQRDMNRLFAGVIQPTTNDYPAVNVWTGKEGAVITAELPGMDTADLDISVVADTVTISGTRLEEPLKEGENYHRQERSYGPFTRTLQLPFSIDPEKVEAKYEKGVLKVTVTRAQIDKPRKIEIKSE
ncbi:MAG: Hsp20/alpha crystallin family protein [Smithellaceae bacterium]|nr:Hsp20/alpha crystallin family protein [Smithellaceae bacterium]